MSKTFTLPSDAKARQHMLLDSDRTDEQSRRDQRRTKLSNSDSTPNDDADFTELQS